MIPITVAIVLMVAFGCLSAGAAWLQRRRDAVAAFAIMADKLNRPSQMPRSAPLRLVHIPVQFHRGPGGRHAK